MSKNEEFFCPFFQYQKDSNGDISICFCNHKKNPEEYEGNCKLEICPLKNKDSLDLGILQKEHKEWATRNFGEQPAYQSLLGMTEELGELAHAHLKQEQGIRNQENHEDSIKDALADMVIFMLGYCNARGINLENIVRDTWNQVKKRDWKKNPDDAHEDVADE